MSKKVCVPLAEGFEEIEAVTLIDILRRAGLAVASCGLGSQRVKGAHGIVIEADRPVAEALDEKWDMVVLPGGMPGSTNLRDDEQIGTLLRQVADAGGHVGAICAAPIALARHGLLDGRAATSYPGFGDQLGRVDYREERVVVDGKLMTSRGPGTAIEFGLAIVTQLVGRREAEQLRQRLLAG